MIKKILTIVFLSSICCLQGMIEYKQELQEAKALKKSIETIGKGLDTRLLNVLTFYTFCSWKENSPSLGLNNAKVIRKLTTKLKKPLMVFSNGKYIIPEDIRIMTDNLRKDFIDTWNFNHLFELAVKRELSKLKENERLTTENILKHVPYQAIEDNVQNTLLERGFAYYEDGKAYFFPQVIHAYQDLKSKK